MNYLLFNPKSDSNHGEENAKNGINDLPEFLSQPKFISVVDLNYDEFFLTLKKEDNVILFGGDGTINYFVNTIYGKALPCNFYLHRAGTGNDFANDLESEFNNNVLLLNKYLENLPTVKVKDKTTHFINGIGFGIDGMACQEAEDLQKKGATKIDYTSITIKLLLLKYKCPNATVNVDGKEYTFKKVYLASVMKGRFYGGGMKVAPNQDRNSDLLTLVVMAGKGKLSTLMCFPSIFKGEHIKNKMTHVFTGKNITVTFDLPTALQIDGEVVRDALTYTVTL